MLRFLIAILLALCSVSVSRAELINYVGSINQLGGPTRIDSITYGIGTDTVESFTLPDGVKPLPLTVSRGDLVLQTQEHDDTASLFFSNDGGKHFVDLTKALYAGQPDQPWQLVQPVSISDDGDAVLAIGKPTFSNSYYNSFFFVARLPATVPVSEPGTLLMASLGVIGLCIAIRRRT
jgi:hypothetical protein